MHKRGETFVTVLKGCRDMTLDISAAISKIAVLFGVITTVNTHGGVIKTLPVLFMSYVVCCVTAL